MYFHSPIRMWKQGNRIVIKVEILDVLLSISSEKHPKQFEKLQKVLNGETLLSFITYELKNEENKNQGENCDDEK
jgi:hypothetical protein